MANFKEELSQIRAFVFDVDGVFTNCKLFVDLHGEQFRKFNVRDIYALSRALQMGYQVAIITGGRGKQIQQLMELWGVKFIYLEKLQKVEPLLNFSDRSGIPLSEMLYVGDDYPDLEPIKMVRLGVAPNDAIDDVRSAAKYVSKFKGGEGCVRDMIEQVLRARGDWFI